MFLKNILVEEEEREGGRMLGEFRGGLERGGDRILGFLIISNVMFLIVFNFDCREEKGKFSRESFVL